MNYFIEGLQGSGKSTLLGKLSEIKADCKVFKEGDYSPIELAWCAYLTEQQYKMTAEKYPELRRKIEELTFIEDDRRIVCYTKIPATDSEFYKDFEQFEIYNGRVPYEEFKNIILARYHKWQGNNCFFECSLFQNIIEDMILFRQASDDEIIGFYKDVKKALEGREYRIMYLECENIKANLDVIRKERCDENGNELWFPMLCGFFNDSPYAVAHGSKDEEGILLHLDHRQKLELRICREVFSDNSVILRSKSYTDSDLIGS